MQTRHLGNSDLEITPIGIGAWAMGGGDWAFSWGRYWQSGRGPAPRVGNVRAMHGNAVRRAMPRPSSPLFTGLLLWRTDFFSPTSYPVKLRGDSV
jgi:hypothetical protein